MNFGNSGMIRLRKLDLRQLARKRGHAMKSRILPGMLAILALPFSVRASLGGDATSVQADRAKMQGTLKSTTGDGFTLHEIQASTGVAVKEYVSPAGKVFAVSWQGPV